MVRNSTRSAIGFGAAVILGVSVLLIAGAAAADRADLIQLTAGPPSISCSPAASTFGEPITCTVAGDATAIRWLDGHTTGLSASHAPVAVGVHEVSLIDGDAVVATTTISIEPDLTIDCDEGTEVLPVYELVSSDTDRTGWAYVFQAADGSRVLPGDADYPASIVKPNLEHFQIGEGTETGICKASSAAADALDGEISWLTETSWQPPQRNTTSMVKPSSKWYWEGTQPGHITATVEVMGEIASERRGIYLSSCG